MSSVNMDKTVFDAMSEHKIANERPWISFEFFPPKTDVSLFNAYCSMHEYDIF